MTAKKSLLLVGAAVFFLLSCQNPFKTGLGESVDVVPPTFNMGGGTGSAEENYYISGLYQFMGVAKDDTTVTSVQAAVREYGASQYGPWEPVSSYDSNSGLWEWDFETRYYPNSTQERPDNLIRVKFLVTDRSGKTIESPEFAYMTKNHAPIVNLQTPSARENQLRFPQVNDIERKVLTGANIMGQAEDKKGIAPGFPKIKFWPALPGTEDTPSVPDYGLEADHPDWYARWMPVSPSDETSPRKAKEFRFPLNQREQNLAGEWEVIPNRPLDPSLRYRFQIWTRDVDGREAFYPPEPGAFVQISLEAGNEFPRFTLLDGNHTEITGAFDPANPPAGLILEDSSPPYRRYVYSSTSVVKGNFKLNLLVSHSAGILTDPTHSKTVHILRKGPGDPPAGTVILPSTPGAVTDFAYQGPLSILHDGETIRGEHYTFSTSTPYASGIYHFNVKAMSSSGAEAAFDYVITVDTEPPILQIERVDGASSPGAGGADYDVNGTVRFHLFADDNETNIRYSGGSRELRWLLTTRPGLDSPADYANCAPQASDIWGYITGDTFDVATRWRTDYANPASPITGLTDGAYKLYVFARDEALNVRVITRDLNLDQSKDIPKITITRGVSSEIVKLNGSMGPDENKSLIHSTQGPFRSNIFEDSSSTIPVIFEDDDSVDLDTVKISILGEADLSGAGLPDLDYNTVGSPAQESSLQTLFNSHSIPQTSGYTAADLRNDLGVDYDTEGRALLSEPPGGIPLRLLVEPYFRGRMAPPYPAMLPDGCYYVEISVGDRANPWKFNTPTAGSNTPNPPAGKKIRFWIGVNLSGPEIRVTNPPMNSFHSGSVSISGTVGDPNGVDTLEYFQPEPYSGGPVASSWRTLTFDGSGNWSLTYNMDTDTDGIDGPDPVHTIRFRATDKLGKQAYLDPDYKLMVDSEPPGVTLSRDPLIVTDPATGDRSVNGVIRFQVSAQDNNGIMRGDPGDPDRYQIKWFLLDAAGQTALGGSDPAFDYVPAGTGVEGVKWGYFTGQNNPFTAYADTRDLVQGTEYKLYIIAKDRAGNISSGANTAHATGSATLEVFDTFKADQTRDKPALELIQPAAITGAGAGPINDSQAGVLVRASITDDDGLDPTKLQVRFSNNGSSWGSWISLYAPPSPPPYGATVSPAADGTSIGVEFRLTGANLTTLLGSDGAKMIQFRVSEDPAKKYDSPKGGKDNYYGAADPGGGFVYLGAAESPSYKFTLDSRPPQIIFSQDKGQTFNSGSIVAVKGWVVERNLVTYGSGVPSGATVIGTINVNDGYVQFTDARGDRYVIKAQPYVSGNPVPPGWTLPLSAEQAAELFLWEVPAARLTPSGTPPADGPYGLSFIVTDQSTKSIDETWNYTWDSGGPAISFTNITMEKIQVTGSPPAPDTGDADTLTALGKASVVISKNDVPSTGVVPPDLIPLLKGTLSDAGSDILKRQAGHVIFSYRFDQPAGSPGPWIDVKYGDSDLESYVPDIPAAPDPVGKIINWQLPLLKTRKPLANVTAADFLDDGVHWVEVRAYDSLGNGSVLIGAGGTPGVPDKFVLRTDTQRPVPYRPLNGNPTLPTHVSPDPDGSPRALILASPTGGIPPTTSVDDPSRYVYKNVTSPTDTVFTLTGFFQEANIAAAGSVEVKIDNNAALLPARVTVSEPFTADKSIHKWVASITGQDAPFSGDYTTDGSHTVTVAISDMMGKRSELRWTFIKDTVAPEVSFTSLEGSPAVTDSLHREITGSVSDGLSYISVMEYKLQQKQQPAGTWTYKEGSSTTWVTLPAVGTGTTVRNWKVDLPVGGYPEGAYRIKVRARDAAAAQSLALGNETADAGDGTDSSWTALFIDTTQPDMDITPYTSVHSVYDPAYPATQGTIQRFYKGGVNGGTYYGRSSMEGKIYLHGTASDANKITHIRARFNGPQDPVITGAEAASQDWATFTGGPATSAQSAFALNTTLGSGGYSGGKWHYEWQIIIDSNAFTNTQTYKIFLQAQDEAGQLKDINGEFGMDTVSPVIHINEPTARLPLTERPIVTGKLLIQGTVEEDNGFGELYYQVGKTEVGSTTWHKRTTSTDMTGEITINPQGNLGFPAGSTFARLTGNIYAFNLEFPDTGMLFTQNADKTFSMTTGGGVNHGDYWVETVPSGGGVDQLPTDYQYLYLFKIPVRLKAVDSAGNETIYDLEVDKGNPSTPFAGTQHHPFVVWLDPDGDKPRATFTSPFPNTVGTLQIGGLVGGTIRISGTAADNDWIKRVAVRAWHADESGTPVAANGASNGGTIVPIHPTMPSLGTPVNDSGVITADGYYLATMDSLSGGKRVNWTIELNGNHELDPVDPAIRRTVMVEVIAWDAETASGSHSTVRISGNTSRMLLHVEKGVPDIRDLAIASPNYTAGSYTPPPPFSGSWGEQSVDIARVRGDFVLRGKVRDDNGIFSVRMRQGSGNPVELIRKPSGQPRVFPATASVAASITSGKNYLIYDAGFTTGFPWIPFGLQVDPLTTAANLQNAFFTATTGGSIPTDGTVILLEGRPDSGKDYFEYEVEIPVTAAALSMAGKADYYPITLEASDLTSPTPFRNQQVINVMIDNFAPLAQYTGNSRHVVGTNYYLQGRAWDIHTKPGDPETGNIGEVDRVELYFERNGSLVSNNEKGSPSGNPGWQSDAALRPPAYNDRYVNDAGSIVPGTPGAYYYPASAHADYLITVNRTVGDMGFTQNGSDILWSYRFNAQDRLQPGPVNLHYVVIDKAGNAAHYVQLLIIRDPASIKITGITLGTDLWNTNAASGETMPVGTNFEHTNFIVRNKQLSIKVDFDGGIPGQRFVKVSYVAGVTGSDLKISQLTADTNYRITNLGVLSPRRDTFFESVGAPLDHGVGTIFKATGRTAAGTGTAKTLLTPVVNTQSTSSTGAATLTVNFSGANFGAGNIVDQMANGGTFLVEVYQPTGIYGGGGNYTSMDMVVLGMNIANADSTPPQGGVWDFNPAAAAASGMNAAGPTGNIWYEPLADGVYPKSYDPTRQRDENRVKPGLYFEGNLLNPRKTGHIEPGKNTGLSAAELRVANKAAALEFDRDTLSGKVIIRGWAYDDQRIREIVVKYRGINTTIIRAKTSNNAFKGHLEAVGGQNAWVDDLIDLQGHRAEWAWVWDTQNPAANAVDLNTEIQVEVRDFKDGPSGTLFNTGSAVKRVDLAPYITGFVRNVNGNPPAARSKHGLYSVARGAATGADAGDTITVQGFNLSTGTGTTLSINGTAAALSGAQTVNAAAFTVAAATASGNIVLSAAGSRQAVNSDPKTHNRVYTTANPWNKENTTDPDTVRWTDFRRAHVWQSTNNNTATGNTANRGLFLDSQESNKGAISAVPGTGIIHGAWNMDPMVSVYRGVNNGASQRLRRHWDQFQEADIHYSSAGRPTVAYMLIGAAGSATGIGDSGGVMVYDGNTSANLPAIGGDSGGQNFYMVERSWRTNSLADRILTRFESVRVVTNGNHIHVSYYDNVDKSMKYWYNISGTNFDNTNYTNNYVTTGTPERNNLLPRHWVNLDGGYNLYDNGYTTYTGGGGTAAGSGTQRAQPSVRGRAGRTADYHGQGIDPGLPVSRDTGLYNSIALNTSGYPVIAYYEAMTGKLYLITSTKVDPYKADDWNAPIALPYNNAGQYVSMVIGAGNTVHLTWMDSATSRLMYVRGTIPGGTAWNPGGSPVVVDRMGTVGKYADISLDSNGNPWITYQDMDYADAALGDVNSVKMAYMPDPAQPWTSGINWETMGAALRFPAKDDKLSIVHNLSGAAQFWEAAVAYHSDSFRIAYYVK